MSYFPHLLQRPLAFPRTERTAADAAERTAGRARIALLALLALTALAYLWDLSASGYANSFYAAAVQAGTKSWKAFFFGSIDSSNFITVDKPPASLWVMELSGRIFGFSSWSMLVPQALEGVAAVALLHASVKRWFGSASGLLAGLILALTPVAALMFRFNNPDALLVLCMVAAAYCLTRAIEKAGTRWLVAAGALLGLAFLAKMMQAFLVLPAFGAAYLVAAPTALRHRLLGLAAGAGAMVASAGWWVAIVALWPASSRPMIDGSSDNSILNLIVGYNGLGRIFGQSGPGGGGGGGGNFSGATGPLRLFNDLMGGQASWLLPAALIGLVAGLVIRGRAPRTDRTRAALIIWGGWLLVTAVVFSFGSGVIHTYYTVALAPAIAALVAIGATLLWRRRERIAARLTLAAALTATVAWAEVLLARTPAWAPWLRPSLIVLAVAALVGLLAEPLVAEARGRRALATLAATLTLLAGIGGPAAYALQTIGTAHTGSVPSAGPASAGGMGSPGGAGGFRGGSSSTRGAAAGGFTPPTGAGEQQLFGSSDGAGTGAGAGGTPPSAATGRSAASATGSGAGGAGAGAGMTVSSALAKALERDAGSYRWVAAVSGSQTAASLELGTGGEPVMAIGGFNGQGGDLTLAQFERYVKEGDIHYYIASAGGIGGAPTGGTASSATGGPPAGSSLQAGAAGGPGGLGRSGAGATGGPGGSSSSSAITSWVKAHYKAVTIGGETVYDLTQAR